MKKNLLLYSILFLGCSRLFAMELPPERKPAIVEDHLVALINQNMTLIPNPMVFKPGFGQDFDYSSLLRPDGDLTELTYKRRLKFFKRYLFDYIDGYTRPVNSTNEASGGIAKFLKEYLKLALTLKATSNSIPLLGDELVVNFVPGSVVTSFVPIRIPMKAEQLCDANPLKIPQGAILEPALRMIQIPAGNFVMSRLVVQTKGKNFEYSPLRIKTQDGTFVIAPYRGQENGKIFIGTKVPCYVITSPDAECISLALSQLQLKNSSIGEKEIAIQSLFKNELSIQAKRILECYSYNLACQKIVELIAQEKQKTKNEPKEEDKKAFNDCLRACPQALELKIMQGRLLQNTENFLIRKPGESASFTKNGTLLLNDLHKHIVALNSLTPEYAMIYRRISDELKKLKNKPLEPKPLEIKKEKIEQFKVLENPVPVKIKYAKRITRWFKDNFVKNKKESSISYHTMLPTLADSIVIKYGERSEYNNKTHKGQKDEHYTIAGKIIDDETKEESYCLFNLCLDPKGICYHRDCKKCKWEELPAELKKGGDVEDAEYEEDRDELGIELGEKPKAIRETNTYIQISHPSRKCTILLYKKLL